MDIEKILIFLIVINILFFSMAVISAVEDADLNSTFSSGEDQLMLDENMESSLQEENNFVKIQEDVDNANEGDIIVLNGSYTSNGNVINVEKSLNFIGSNDAVITNNGSQIFSIESAGQVSFKNIKFVDSEKYFHELPFIKANNTKIYIYNCTFVQSRHAVEITNSLDSVISNCSVMGDTDSYSSKGVFSLEKSIANVNDCTFEINGDNVLIKFDTLKNSVIDNCRFYGTCYNAIRMREVNNCNITNCNLSNSHASHVFVSIRNMNNSYFKNIKFMNAEGLSIDGYGFYNSKITNCNFTKSGESIKMREMFNSSIVNCSISECNPDSYHVAIINCSGNSNKIIDTKLINNRNSKIDAGIYLHGSNMLIDGCEFRDDKCNGQYGFIQIRATNTTVQNSYFNRAFDGLYTTIGWLAQNGTLKSCYFSDDVNILAESKEFIYKEFDIDIIKTYDADLFSGNGEPALKYQHKSFLEMELRDQDGFNVTGLRYIYFYKNPDFTDYVGTLKVNNGRISIDEGFKNVTGGINKLYACMKGYTYDLTDPEVTLNVIAQKVNLSAESYFKWTYDTSNALDVKLTDENGEAVYGILSVFDGDERIGECNVEGSISNYVYLSPSKVGQYNITLKFRNEDGLYADAEMNYTMDVGKKTLQFNTTDLIGNIFKVHLLRGANKEIILDFNGNIINGTTDENGHVEFDISSLNLKTGAYPVKVSFGDDVFYNHIEWSGIANYFIKESSKADNIVSQDKVISKPKKTTPKMLASKKTFKAKAKTKKYVVTLKAGKKAIKKAKVTLKIKGKTVSAKTNAKGKATFKIKLNKKGKYKALIRYSGNSAYNSVKKTVVITIR